MTRENIKEKSFNVYCAYKSHCDIIGVGLAQNYEMIREQILEQHTRTISFNKSLYLYSTYIDNKKKLTAKTLDALQDKIVKYYLENMTGVYSFNALFSRACEFNLSHEYLSKSTIDRYRADYEKYIVNELLFQNDIRSITEHDLIQYFNEFMKNKPTSKNLSNLKTVIRMVFSYARVQEEVECLHVNTVFGNMQFSRRAFAPKKKPVERVFSDDDVQKLFCNLNPENETDLGIKLCFYTGLRVGELCALKKKDIDFNERTLTIKRAETVCGRGSERIYEDTLPKCYKERTVYLSSSAIEILKVLCSYTDNYLFPKNETHIHARCFDARIRRLCKKADIPIFSLHDIRRTYATHLLDSEVTEKFVQEQLGHSDIRTTQNYYYYSTKRKEEYRRMAEISAI